jgi:hypothetical protein
MQVLVALQTRLDELCAVLGPTFKHGREASDHMSASSAVERSSAVGSKLESADYTRVGQDDIDSLRKHILAGEAEKASHAVE